MKTKIVLWGTNGEEERTLIALELRAEENMVNIYTFGDQLVSEEFNQQMMKEWREGVSVDFPEGYQSFERELTITDNLLPDHLKVERGDLIQRAQTEWHFIVLSSKLYATYQSELDQLKDKVEQLEKYDGNLWDVLKQFWDKVQKQVQERNMFKEHADALRDNTNVLFGKLKDLRSKLDDDFKKISSDNQEKFLNKLKDIEQKIEDGLRLQPLFDELKKMQKQFRDIKLTRDHRTKVWEKLDAAFKAVKEKKFGAKGDDRSPLERVQRRFDGLISAIEKMERSINRDKDDLNFQNKKIEATDGQLEAQIRQAKILMIEERIRSKEEKLNEMLQTKAELEKRIESQKEKDVKRVEKEKLDAAKKVAEEKIAKEIKEAVAAREGESGKLEKAAEAIVAMNPGKSKNLPEDADEEAVRENEHIAEMVAINAANEIESSVNELKASMDEEDTTLDTNGDHDSNQEEE